MLEFLVSNWQLLASILLAIISVIIAFIRKRPLGNVYALVFRYCLAAVMMAEEHPVKGEEKKQLAIDAVHELLLEEYPTLNVKSYDNVISNVIEAILSTPQKKGE